MAETTKAITTLEIGADGAFQIPVTLKRITSQTEVSLDSASPAGNPVKLILKDATTDEEFERSEARKGVFRSKPNKSKKESWSDFVEISKDDLDVIAEATNIENFTVDHFIPLKDVPLERVTDAYFLAPAEGMSAKPLVLLAKALKRTKRAGVFKMVKSSRQYLAVVYEKNGGLIVNTLAFSADCAAAREAGEALDRSDVKIAPGELALAEMLVGEVLATDAAVIDGFEDDLIPLRADLIEQALKGKIRLKPGARKKVQQQTDDGLEARLRETLRKAGKTPVPA